MTTDIALSLIEECGVLPASWLEALSLCLAGSEPERLGEFRDWWRDWFAGVVPGRKLTVVAWEGEGPPPCAGRVTAAVGVVRFWESPYCGGKWFVEGLEVIENRRRQGVATRMMLLGIERLGLAGVRALHAHIYR